MPAEPSRKTVALEARPHSADPTGGIRLGPPLKPRDLGSLGPYRVIRPLGSGGMGLVFLGVDPKLRRKVALKVIHPREAARPDARERFLREARALAAVKNDHIVTIYQVDEAEGIPYLALEYLQGSTLEKYLKSGPPLTMPQLVHVARQVAAGLAAAHEHNVIHRDIKPENIWLEAPEGRVKLIDFGLARPPAAASQGPVFGTPSYMSPEQARGGEVDARSDLFSLGSVLYRLISGAPPFTGENAFAVVLAMTQHPHAPLRNPHAPEALTRLVDALLAKDPRHRPASARDVAKELRRIESQFRHAETDAGPAAGGTTLPIADTENAWAGLETEAAYTTRWHTTRLRRSPGWPLVLGLVALTAAAVALTLIVIKPTMEAPASSEPRKVRSVTP